jgi:hypothetical protein
VIFRYQPSGIEEKIVMRSREITAYVICAAFIAGCGAQAPSRPDRPAVDPTELGGPSKLGKADGFDWGSGCKGGSGTFTQDISKNTVVTVGTIPVGKANIEIKLTSAKDVDIQLFAEDGTKIVQWPDGQLNAEGEGSVTYKGVKVKYSGYNGDGTNLGHEYIKLTGTTTTTFTMKAFGYAAGSAKVDYTFEAPADCTDSGSGTFTQTITKDAVVKVGDIPVGLENIKIALKSSVDIDIQLYKGSTKVVHWSDGLIKGATKVSKTYDGVKITWSGYNGDGTGKGNEYIEIEGKTQSPLVMKVFGYEAGSAKVTYSWGKSSGGGGDTYKPFSQRLTDFAAKYPTQVVLAKKAGKPAIFVDTKVCTTKALTKAFYADLNKMMGPNTLSLWNPAEENYFHLGLQDSTKLDEMYRNKSIRLYSHIHIWDNTLGNLDDECDSNYDDDNEYLDYVEDPCYDSYQVKRERTVALVKLTNTQMVELNTYLDAIVDDFDGTLGPAEYNGGKPPYFGGSKHNCTSWFTYFLNKKVSTQFSSHASPASMMKSYTGAWGSVATAFRALLVYNHPNPPASGATLSASFPLEVGH